MATGWTITLGYNGQSGLSYKSQWELLKQHATALIHSPDYFMLQGAYIVDTGLHSEENLRTYLSSVTINEDPENRYIMLRAAGGTARRDWKEDVARLFVWRLMERMLNEHLNITVVSA